MVRRSISVSRTLNALIVWTVLVPFVPVLLPASDTQPTFLLLFSVALIVSFASPAIGRRLFRFTLPGAMTGILAATAIYAFLVSANLLQQESSVVSRLVSFFQFVAAAFWGYAGKFKWSEKILFRAVLLYAVFTVIYFAAGGLIENTLIHSRTENAEVLFSIGRGARTLSPEPSFFALQIFNLFVLARVIFARDAARHFSSFRWLLATAFCLTASFSAYGAILLFVIVFALYPAIVIIGVAASVLVWSFLSRFLADRDSVRAIQLLLTLIQARGSLAELAILDASFSSRLGSFGDYVRSFMKHPFIGNGFSLYQGGGFISIIAAFGLSGLAYFAWLLRTVVSSRFDVRTRIILLVWFALNFVSGPIGVPIIGVIIGQIFAARKSAAPVRATPVAAPTELAVAR